MSRSLVYDDGKVVGTRIVNIDECKWLVDDICCNAESSQVTEFPFPDYCEKHCRFFTKEDGYDGQKVQS